MGQQSGLFTNIRSSINGPLHRVLIVQIICVCLHDHSGLQNVTHSQQSVLEVN